MKLKHKLGFLAVSTVALIATAAPAVAHGKSDEHKHKGQDQVTVLATKLRSTNETPSNDTGGKGKAKVWIDGTTVCYSLKVKLTEPATAAHIHKAPVGVAGPVVLPLNTPDAKGKSKGCIQNVDPLVVADMVANPTAYYVNVHTATFPGGATRGQLKLVSHHWHHHKH